MQIIHCFSPPRYELKLITLRFSGWIFLSFLLTFPTDFRLFTLASSSTCTNTRHGHTDTCCQTTTTHGTIKKLLFFWQTNFPPCHPLGKIHLKPTLKLLSQSIFLPIRWSTLISTKTLQLSTLVVCVKLQHTCRCYFLQFCFIFTLFLFLKFPHIRRIFFYFLFLWTFCRPLTTPQPTKSTRSS